MNLTVVILALNEERHIRRAVESVRQIASQIVVVDAGSTDRTEELAAELGVTFIFHHWRNHSSQFNWALENLPRQTRWILRLDADEIVSEKLRDEIISHLSTLDENVSGVYVGRRMNFLGRPIRHGGIFPVRVLRLFRHGRGRCEDRWMDEHILVNGKTADFRGDIVDDNVRSLTWWTEKHNGYSSREVIDMLNLNYSFTPHESIADLRGGRQAGIKRWIKERIYVRMPWGMRAFAYFFYRFILCKGFLDGREGRAFHVLQGLWYRYLVDVKYYEVERYMEERGVEVEEAIEVVLGIRIPKK